MAFTLGTTGMDSATEAELRDAFASANATAGGRWQLVPESEAEYVVVDMDSMYGPMSWLRLHAAGKKVIGLTEAVRTQTDFRLGRPLSGEELGNLLAGIVEGGGLAAPEAPVAVPSGMSPAPVPQDQLPEEHPQHFDEEAEAPAPAPGLPASVEAGSLAPTSIEPAPAPVHAAPAPAPAAPPQAATPARERTLGDWLAAGALDERVRFQRAGGPEILIDPQARQYYGPAALKPLAGYFEGAVDRKDFAPAGAGWDADASAQGAAQPLSRLQWYGGLLAGRGRLLPGYDADARFRLGKWPQTEREFPKHFRIATAMMKGPATLPEIAAASSVPLDEVTDFVNANLATGFAEPYREPEPEPEPQKSGGLFGRLRGK
jgi:hypothetical protein